MSCLPCLLLIVCCTGQDAETSAVARGLAWLAEVQAEDGSWYALAPNSKSGDAETEPDLETTSLALLAYLGARQTHKHGTYKRNIQRGLDYVVGRMKKSEIVGDLRDGKTLRTHGMAALVLCEAYGMTGDKKLLAPAQLAVRFTERSQNSVTGGWGRQPRDADDLHIFGWQLLTIRSAANGDLLIGDEIFPRLQQQLDSVATEEGSFFGRHMPGQEVQATAIGLYGRAFVEAQPMDDTWRRGANWLAQQEPAPHDIERNFFTTLALRQAPKELWQASSPKLRDQVLERLERHGSSQGSWFDKDDVAASQGRVYQTALNVLALEVYYRHLPMFSDVWPTEEKKEESGVPDPFGDESSGEDPFGQSPAGDDPFG